MTDPIHRAFKWLSHHRYMLLALTLTAAAAAILVSCQPRTPSIAEPAQRVTREELRREVVVAESQYKARRTDLVAATQKLSDDVASHNLLIEQANIDLANQETIRDQVLATVAGLATLAAGGGLDPVTAIGALVQLLTATVAGGALLDIRRKNRRIAELDPPAADRAAIPTAPPVA